MTNTLAAPKLAWTTPALLRLSSELGDVANGLGGLTDGATIEASNTSGAPSA